MLEAVGHEYLPDFYRAVDELMRPHGICVVQVITTPDDRYEDYRHCAEFINTHIFPGACCPSFGALTAAATAASTLTVEAVENIGPHYVPTLAQWRRNFLANADKLLALGFDDVFIRKWEYATSCASNRLSAPRSALRPAVRCPSPPFADLR